MRKAKEALGVKPANAELRKAISVEEGDGFFELLRGHGSNAKGQTVAEYGGLEPAYFEKIITLVPIGKVEPRLMATVQRFLQIFLNSEVHISQKGNFAEQRLRMYYNGSRLNESEILQSLARSRDSGTFALGVTCLPVRECAVSRAGIICLDKFDQGDRLAYAFLSQFMLRHWANMTFCPYFQCIMNEDLIGGSFPLVLCPVCLRKLSMISPLCFAERYKNLYSILPGDPEQNWIDERLAFLGVPVEDKMRSDLANLKARMSQRRS